MGHLNARPSHAALDVCEMLAPRRGRPPKHARIGEEDALAALSALSEKKPENSTHSEKHLSRMRERKGTIGRDRAELRLAEVKGNVGVNIAAVAEVGNLHMSAASNSNSKLNTTGRSSNGKAWNPRSALQNS